MRLVGHLLIGALAAGLAVSAVQPASAQAPPPAAAQPVPAAATVKKVEWLSDRRVALWVNSPSMGVPVQVQLLLARDWNSKPQAKFPALYMLDGMRALDIENGWTLDAKAQPFFAEKNVNVVLPIGGQSSFYADWLKPDNGRNYKWETFLIKELPPLLEGQWRTTQVRGLQGLSMGGTAAMFLAARNQGFAKYAASYSGFLTTTTLGMPQAIQYAMSDAGGFHSASMWGPPSSDAWKSHDPYLLADKLKGISLYVSSGSGLQGPYDKPSSQPGISSNYAGMGLEVLARMTSQNFATKLDKLRIPVQVNNRPSGTHSWPYWDFEMRQSWPQAAAALGTEAEKPACALGGLIGKLAQSQNWLGDCLTGEYNVNGGVAQDYRNGQVFYSTTGGTHAVGGAIAGAYQANGGPTGALGLPKSGERVAPDGRGRYQLFEKGNIYWTPQTGAHAVRGAILREWAAQGYERGPLGYPALDESDTPVKSGSVQGFQHGVMYFSPSAGTHPVLGQIMGKYAQLGYENSWLGFPKSRETKVRDNGRFTRFENGNIYWSLLSGAWAVRNGAMFDAWKSVGYENGRLGFPISDEFPIPGGVQQNYQRGFITVKDGKAEIR